MTLVEICLDDLAGAEIAERSGADRIELCADLASGGTTPRIESVATVLTSVRRVGVQILIRQRPGDFTYSRLEVDAMVADIAAIRSLRRSGPTTGFVIGALTVTGRVDTRAVIRLLDACGSAPVTFHRAFDEITDQPQALEELIDLGLQRVLTSGGRPTADEGIDELARLVTQAGNRLSILAAGSIRAHNVAEIVRRTGVCEVHLRAPGIRENPSGPGRSLTSAAVVLAVREALTATATENPRPAPAASPPVIA